MQQLHEGGRIVAPVGPADQQELLLVVKHDEVIEEYRLGACVFVPLIGLAAWPETRH
jgi:protein-L-isoaspartate(D-aspartate) O-methyltransferase